ncbi:MAG TPA: OmpA family protein [Gammaproteobacteria bacterium]|nr:OmpA family protein [Gammaproteobacteria bacterium]
MIGRKTILLLGAMTSITFISITSLYAAPAAVEETPAYWTDSSGEILRDSSGQCYRTQLWEAKYAIAACESADIVDTDKDGVANSQDACPDNEPGVEVDARGCELDSDNDGLVNRLDKCPNTVAGSKVDAAGCQLVVVTLDQDNDGVADSSDSCPSTSAGAQVDSKGCELDSDGDSVVDSRDQCINTASGLKVDAKGCKLVETLTLKGVNFEPNSNLLKDDSIVMLKKVADTLKQHPDMIIEIAGYTDSQGSQGMNKKLSEKRAISVANYLRTRGVPAANLQTKGYGMASPIADNSSAEGRAKNRRVELRVVQQPKAQAFQFALDQ